MASWPHLKAAAIAAWQTHDLHDHGDGWQSQLHPYHRKGIRPGAPSLQHQHLWPANHRLQKMCICWRPKNHACWWRLAGSGSGAEQGHGNRRWIPPDLEAKAQHYKEMVSAVFNLNNKEAKRELKVNHNNKTTPFCSKPKCLGVTLDRWLTYRRHLESLRKKLSRALLWRLAGSGWSAVATTLRIATLALVHSTAEHRAPVWCHSAHTHLTDPAINDDLPIVTGCLRPTPTDNLPILTGVQPAEIRRKVATLSLTRRAMEPGHLFHSALTYPPGANARRLKSRHPFMLAAQQLISLSDNNNIRAVHRVNHQRKVRSGWTTSRDSILSSSTPAPTLPEWPSRE